MINLIMTPQRSELKAEYATENDVLTVTINDMSEVFDFTNVTEGIAEEIISELLPVNPIVSAEKIGETINITVIQFYGEAEKELYEVAI